jgi:hypothetical protein
VNHEAKARLTHSSSGSPGGEGPRTHIQVLANSGVATVLILLHAWSLRKENGEFDDQCLRRGAWPRTSDVLVAGIVAYVYTTPVPTLTFSNIQAPFSVTMPPSQPIHSHLNLAFWQSPSPVLSQTRGALYHQERMVVLQLQESTQAFLAPSYYPPQQQYCSHSAPNQPMASLGHLVEE